MKKLLVLCLTAILCLCCLASCSIFGAHSISYADKETERLLHDGYAPKRANPGDTVVLRAGPIMDADLYFYANGEPIKNTHNDSDYWEYTFIMPDEDVIITHEMSGDGPVGKCNHQWDNGVEVEGGNGGYVMEYTCALCGDKQRETITIIPPENHFLRNQAGCEWLAELSAEDIAEIKIISEAVGVAPGNLNNVSSSTDEAVIARIFEDYYWLDTAPISKMEGQIDGGGGVTVKFILKNGTAKELYINNGNYRDTNGDYFELLYTPKFKDTDNAVKAYGFITYLGTGTVYDKDNHSVCEIPIDELEFVESDGCVDAVVIGYYYTVETEFGTLYFDYSNDLFYLQFEEGEVDYIEYYQLVGKNLDELIAEYSITTE